MTSSEKNSPQTSGLTDPLIGDAEIVAIRFGVHELEIEIHNRTEDRRSSILFSGVRFFQFCTDGPFIFDRIDLVDSIADALKIPSLASLLNNRDLIGEHPLSTIARAGCHLFRFIPIAGAESFVVCSHATMGEWHSKD